MLNSTIIIAQMCIHQWVLLLQEFDLEIKDKKETKNLVVGHLSQLKGPYKEIKINDDFPDEQLLAIEDKEPVPCFCGFCELLGGKSAPPRV